MKKYKASEPDITIKRICEILNDACIKVSEECFVDASNSFYSAHLRIISGKLSLMDISTNGKGKTREYALASAYGELMERLPSKILFGLRYSIPSTISNFKYVFAPDEKPLVGQDFRYSLQAYTSLPSEVVSFYNEPKEIGLPFADIHDKSIVYLPMRAIEHCCGSNGMCAGNTRHEAILQGMCEIFERYALRLIYHKALTPPLIHSDIPISENLKNKIKHLESLEECKIEIVDCSCGIGLPVYGLRIIRNKTLEYQFHLGADMTAEFAIERVLTELFQNSRHIPMRTFDIPYQLKLCNDLKLIENERVKYSFRCNHIPLSVFSENPSYKPMKFDPERGQSDLTDLKIAFGLVYNLGKKVYIRDNSFMGFHAYTIYIPGMSELINVESIRWMQTSFEKSIMIPLMAHRLPNASSDEVADFVKSVSAFSTPAYIDWFTNDDVWRKGSSRFVVGLAAAVVNNWNLALRQLGKLKDACGNEQLKYLYSFYYDYCAIASIGANPKEYLCKIYDENMYSELEKTITSSEWKKIFDFTDCFNCEKCMKSEKCALQDYIHLVKTIDNIHEKNILDQTALFGLLD